MAQKNQKKFSTYDVIQYIKIRSAGERKGSRIVPADGDQRKSRLNVRGMIREITSAIEKCDIPFETQTFNVLQKYDSKCTTSLHQFFKFHYNQLAAMALGTAYIRKIIPPM